VQVLTHDKGWVSLEGQRITHVELEEVPATVTRMDLFDKLLGDAPAPTTGSKPEPPIVRGPNGDIAKRMDDVRDGFQVPVL
jgi:hypothetical protein